MKITKDELRLGRFVVPFRVYGEAAKALVCVSGAQQTMAVWRSVTSYFAGKYSVVVFDSPGQGRSRILSGPPGVSLDEQVEILHQVICSIDRPFPVDLAAASWGTIVASAYASRYPACVQKLVLGSFGAKPSPAMLEVISEGQRLVNENRGPEIAHLMIERFGQHIPRTYKKRIIEQFRRMSEQQFLSFYAHSGLVENARHIDDYIDLRNIKAKTLIVNGEEDTILNPEDVDFAEMQIPDCRVHWVPGAGHFLHFERDDVLDIYGEFLLAS